MLLLFLLLNSPVYSAPSTPNISSEAAIVIDANTGKILFEKNINKKLAPASTTKIMTGILAIEMGDLSKNVIIDKETPLGIIGSHIALEPGEILTFEDLLYALLIQSANDSAKAIAINLSGSVEEFAKLMNKKAKELGAKNTHFVNPHGLDEENHFSTAYDLAIIAKYAMKNDTFRNIVNNYKYKIEKTNKKDVPRYLKSQNKLMYSNEEINVDGNYIPIKYSGANGIKTGFTDNARYCLVSSAKRGEQELIAVVLKASNMKALYTDTHNLLNFGFDNFYTNKIAYERQFIKNVKVENGDKAFVTTVIDKNLSAIIPKGTNSNIETKLNLPDKLKAPIPKGRVIGNIEYLIDGKTLGTANIIAAIEVNQKPLPAVIDSKSNNFILKKWWSWPIVLFLIWRSYISVRRYKKRKKRKRRKATFVYSKKI